MTSGNKPLVGIVMGSDSDITIMQKAAEVLKDFSVGYEMRILSAHRVPNKLKEFISQSEKKGIKVFIAGAGLAAHLPGVVAAYTTLPVIGVPLKSGALNGFDSLLSIVQMPPGVPVATVAIDGSKNAALLALQILATKEELIADKLKDYKKEMESTVLQKDAELNKI
ncbi:MAG TPA: 5-(carboxyamino)imidazole ribonucleotide mutase [Melioribacteraceae bacterium]|nr:5-(carboxyamino)imidazole ribonucleotide mutase [Melioribacteraceae bacterium]